MSKDVRVLYGTFLYAETLEETKAVEDAYLVAEEGKIVGFFKELPEKYEGVSVEDYAGKLIIPGMCDLHIHAAQYAYRGLGMDMELLDWLNVHAFPEEARFASLDYAKKAYEIFTDDLKHSVTTRANVFATLHKDATLELMRQLEDAGLPCHVGKLSMDRNSPDYYREPDAATALKEEEEWLIACQDFKVVKPVITPRFTPTCSDELMRGLGELQKKYNVKVQSHLSENLSEIAWVKELCPWSSCYGDAYLQVGMMPEGGTTVMAHCVHCGEEELQMLIDREVFMAHCPQCNINVCSGVVPTRYYLNRGLNIGLGTDIAGGASLSMFRVMTDAVFMSKIHWLTANKEDKVLNLKNAFYMATKGGGKYFGKVGSFEPGYELDAVVLDDSTIRTTNEVTTDERLERLAYLSETKHIVAKYAAGVKVL